jgi:hypothetical protein
MSHVSTSPEIYKQLKENNMNEEMIYVYKQGTTVEMKVGSIVGMITGISVKFVSVLYEITYYADGLYHTIWANELEFEPRSKEKTQVIGFKS